MTNSHKYPLKNRQHRHLAAFAAIAVCVLLSLLLPQQGFAGEDPPLSYDEILVFMNVQGVGGVQIQAAIHKEAAYLAITDVFDFLKIRNTTSPGWDSIAGFFIAPQATFLIDVKHNRIIYQGKKIELPRDAIIRTTTNVYLRSDYFGQVFGLECKFNFRSLSVVLHTSLDLPVIREIRQEAMRNNLNHLKGEMKADTSILRSYPLFRLGMADWAVVATQNVQGSPGVRDTSTVINDTRVSLGLGGVVAGGETNVLINYDNTIPFAEREQYYQWRYVDNNNPGLRQVMAGKIFTPSIFSIYSPVVGVQFTNAPTTYRRSFGSYTLDYYAEAGWMVELYVNNSLVDYSKAETAGYHRFKVPLVYGNSVVKLRFYSPWGEERSSEQTIQVPFTFLPLHEFEYTATAGIVEDSLSSRFSRANFNYGLTERLTVGGGIEYLSSVTTGKTMPFVNASLRLGSNLLLAGEYTYGVRSKFTANYHLPSDLLVELDYTRYKEGQRAINNTFLEERRAIVSYPFRSRKFTLFSRLTAYQIVLPSSKFALSGSKYTTVEGLLSGALWGVNTNITTYALFEAPARPYVYSDISMAFRLPGKIIFTPQAQYEYNAGKVIGMKGELGKYVNSRGYLNVFYEKNFKSQFESVGIGLRYDFSSALTGLSVALGNHTANLVQSASGSLMYDDRTNYLGFTNRSNIGKGGIIVIPYLDLNGNGRRDNGEPKVSGLTVHINGGRIQNNKTDTTIRVSGLEAYANYLLRLDPAFENIAWHIRNQTISIIIDPNQFKILEIPVAIAGEVAGMVYRMNGKEEVRDGAVRQDSAKLEGRLRPQDRIIVCFYRSDSTLAGQAVTESDGSFDFSGLAPGTYMAGIAPAQLRKLNMTALPLSLPFTILPKRNGDVVEGLRFVLRSVPAINQ